jgi:hypothetical protein
MQDSINPYAPPVALLESAEQLGDVLRDGRHVRLEKDGRLPERCIVCNAAGTGRRVTRRLFWSPLWWRLSVIFVPVGFIGFATVAPAYAGFFSIAFWPLVALLLLINPFIRSRAEVDVAVCSRHERQHRITLGISVALLTLVSGLLVGLFTTTRGAYGAALFIAIALMLVFETARRLLGPLKVHAAKIDQRRLWLRGAGRPFLEGLPEVGGRE